MSYGLPAGLFLYIEVGKKKVKKKYCEYGDNISHQGHAHKILHLLFPEKWSEHSEKETKFKKEAHTIYSMSVQFNM